MKETRSTDRIASPPAGRHGLGSRSAVASVAQCAAVCPRTRQSSALGVSGTSSNWASMMSRVRALSADGRFGERRFADRSLNGTLYGAPTVEFEFGTFCELRCRLRLPDDATTLWFRSV